LTSYSTAKIAGAGVGGENVWGGRKHDEKILFLWECLMVGEICASEQVVFVVVVLFGVENLQMVWKTKGKRDLGK
jgi:hypothetical protein